MEGGGGGGGPGEGGRWSKREGSPPLAGMKIKATPCPPPPSEMKIKATPWWGGGGRGLATCRYMDRDNSRVYCRDNSCEQDLPNAIEFSKI